MNRPRVFGVLRITVTVLSLTACMLLVTLWLRSYESLDIMCSPVPDGQTAEVQSKQGWLGIIVRDATSRAAMYSMGRQSTSVVDTLWPRKLALIHNSNKTAVIVPHWFVLLFFGGFVVVPWIKWRFTLRTLLIAITLGAVVLGAIVTSM